MFNSSILDTLIACVVVILILSLVVQAVQTAIKKLLKLKSRQIEDSLVDLFQNALDQLGNKPAGKFDPQARWFSWQGIKQFIKIRINRSPVLRLLWLADHPSDLAQSSQVKTLYDSVVNAFQEVGRVTSRGHLMLDSLAKGDLLKILDKVGTENLLPEGADRIKTVTVTLATVLAEAR